MSYIRWFVLGLAFLYAVHSPTILWVAYILAALVDFAIYILDVRSRRQP